MLPVLAGPADPAVAPRRDEVGRLPGGLREGTPAHAGLDVLREAVAKSDAASRKATAAAAWHAEPIVRLICSTFSAGIVGVRVSDGSRIVITATPRGDGLVEASIAVGPEGNCACRIGSRDTHLASTALDSRSFEWIS